MSVVTIDRAKAMELAFELGRQASDVIAGIYAQDFAVEYKGPNDPVTKADKEANAIICDALAKAYPGMPLVAEESAAESYAGFGDAEAAWFIDPLDGTRDFVAKNGEFCVMIGLAEKGRATVGAIVCPALRRAFLGAEGVGAFEVDSSGARKAIRVASTARIEDASLVGSRSHRTPEEDAALGMIGAKQILRVGSAGIKAAKIACGEADLYVRTGRAGKLWDACGPEAIVRAAGGSWLDSRGKPYDYRRDSLEIESGVIAGNPALASLTFDKLTALVNEWKARKAKQGETP